MGTSDCFNYYTIVSCSLLFCSRQESSNTTADRGLKYRNGGNFYMRTSPCPGQHELEDKHFVSVVITRWRYPDAADVASTLGLL